jgi:hypothetical protein
MGCSVFSPNRGEAKGKLAAKLTEEQALRSSLPALSRQILELAETRDEITVKEIGFDGGRTATPSKFM